MLPVGCVTQKGVFRESEVMKKFLYMDNDEGQWIEDHWTAPTVFSCQAETITEADELFKQKTGKDVTKMPWIGCRISAENGQ